MQWHFTMEHDLALEIVTIIIVLKNTEEDGGIKDVTMQT